MGFPHIAKLMLLLAFSAPFGPQARADKVDAAIVFAVDSSASIDSAAADLQRHGHVKALRSPEIIAAIGRSQFGCVAITYFEWSSYGRWRLVLPWKTICGSDDANAAATIIAEAGSSDKRGIGGHTSISFAIDMACTLLERFPGETSRKIIDISANGTNNDGPAVRQSRVKAIANGYTINAIAVPPIQRGVQYDITAYFAQNVIGGSGAFVIAPMDESDYVAALRWKMVVEVSLSSGASGHQGLKTR